MPSPPAKEVAGLQGLCCRSLSLAPISSLPVANQTVPLTPADAGVNESPNIQKTGITVLITRTFTTELPSRLSTYFFRYVFLFKQMQCGLDEKKK